MEQVLAQDGIQRFGCPRVPKGASVRSYRQLGIAFSSVVLAVRKLMPAVPLIITAAAFAWGYQQYIDPNDVLDFGGTTYDANTGKVHLSVANKSTLSVLAYGAVITYKYADGSTVENPVSEDWAPTLGMEGRVLGLQPGTFVGEFLPRMSSRWEVPARDKNGQLPVSASLSASFVIFTDNTVIGPDRASAHKLFAQRQAEAGEYRAFIASLKRAQTSADPSAALQDVSNELKARAIPRGMVRAASDRDLFLRNIERLRTMRSEKPLKQRLSAYLADLENRYALIVQHTEEVKGGTQQ